MTSGRICIGSRIAGTIDIIEDGVTGYLFKPGDYTELSAHIEKVVALSNIERERMGLEGRKKIEKEFDRKIVLLIPSV